MNTFKIGGIHPNPEKRTSGAQHPITAISRPAQLTLLLGQGIGKPARPVVKAGDEVVRGQLIAEADGPISANLHAPLSGKVHKLAKVRDMQGYWKDAIILDVSDDAAVVDFPSRTEEEIASLSSKDIVEEVRWAGIVGLGGAAFPTAVKLTPPPDMPVDTVILNGAECEPYLTCDDRLMCERATGILRGAELLMRAVGVSRCLVGIEHNKPEAIKAMTRAAESFTGIEIVPLRTKYPQGGEKQLIEALTGRQVPSGKLPAAVGCIVDNVASAYAVYEAVWLRKPLIERVVTVTGRGLELPGNYLVPLGTSLAHLLEGCVWDDSTNAEVIAGGPMMGRSVSCLDAPVQKATSGLLTMDATMNKRRPEQPCIRCGRCMHGCPMGLEPFLLLAMSRKRMWQEMKDNFALDCIECGSCSWSCPAYKPLLDFIKIGKMEIRKRKL